MILSNESLSISEKINIIQNVIKLTESDPEQGSILWASERQIGGSDMAAVQGKGYFGKGFFEVVKEKIFNNSNFTGNLATRFGRIMEEFSRRFIEKVFTTEVWELKSLPNQLKYTSYSPDGVTVMNVFKQLLMVLLEFKTPLSRIPDGKIPNEYLPQIKAGMCALPMVSGSVFMNTMLRICNINDFKYNFEYNTRVHKGDISVCKSRPNTHKSKLDKVLAFGVCVFVQTKEQIINAKNKANEIDPILLQLGLTEGTVNKKSNGDIFISYDIVSPEDDLFENCDLSKEQQLINANNLEKNINYYYNNPNNNNNNNPNNNNNNYKNALLHQHEKDFGNHNENDLDMILNYADKKHILSSFHIPPFIVNDNLAQMEFMNKCGLVQENKINPNYINAESQQYFIETMKMVRKELEESNTVIVGILPYKIFKMDLIYQKNNDPNFIKSTISPQIEMYSKIKVKCNEIDQMNLSKDEKENKKYEVLYEYFPNKAPVNTGSETLLQIMEDDKDSLF